MMAGGALGHAGSDHLTDERGTPASVLPPSKQCCSVGEQARRPGTRDHDGDAESAIA